MARQDKMTRSAPSATLEALRASIGVLRWVLMLLVVVYLASNVRVVGPNENGLVLRFGRPTGQIHPPGLLVAMPFPIDRVIKVPTRTVQEIQLDDWAAPAMPAPAQEAADAAGGAPAPEAPPIKETLHPVDDGYLLTGDVNLVHASFSVRYTISDPRAYALNAKDTEHLLREGPRAVNPQPLFRAILRDAATEAVQSIGVDDALTSGQERLRHECLRIAQGKIDRLGLGLALQAWEIREIVPARQVLQAFEEVVSAKVEARTLSEKANAYRQARLPEIEARVFRIEQEADGLARRIVERARGEATSFIAQWEAARENLDAFRIRRHMEIIEWVMRRTWLPAINAGQGLPLQLMIRPPAHDPEPITD